MVISRVQSTHDGRGILELGRHGDCWHLRDVVVSLCTKQ